MQGKTDVGEDGDDEAYQIGGTTPAFIGKVADESWGKALEYLGGGQRRFQGVRVWRGEEVYHVRGYRQSDMANANMKVCCKGVDGGKVYGAGDRRDEGSEGSEDDDEDLLSFWQDGMWGVVYLWSNYIIGFFGDGRSRFHFACLCREKLVLWLRKRCVRKYDILFFSKWQRGSSLGLGCQVSLVVFGEVRRQVLIVLIPIKLFCC